MRRLLPAAALVIGLALVAPGQPSAQVRPVYSRGAMGQAQLLQRLQTTAGMLHTGAP
ncbi:MAG: hypothetical protein ABL971_15740 [Vicinamibacterales bacterium]